MRCGHFGYHDLGKMDAELKRLSVRTGTIRARDTHGGGWLPARGHAVAKAGRAGGDFQQPVVLGDAFPPGWGAGLQMAAAGAHGQVRDEVVLGLAGPVRDELPVAGLAADRHGRPSQPVRPGVRQLGLQRHLQPDRAVRRHGKRGHQCGPAAVSGVAGANLDTGGGPARATLVGGPVTATTEGGQLMLRGVTGPLRAGTGGGTLLAQDVAAATATITTSGGSAMVTFAAAPGFGVGQHRRRPGGPGRARLPVGGGRRQ
jgi:hypothetical protein